MEVPGGQDRTFPLSTVCFWTVSFPRRHSGQHRSVKWRPMGSCPPISPSRIVQPHTGQSSNRPLRHGEPLESALHTRDLDLDGEPQLGRHHRLVPGAIHQFARQRVRARDQLPQHQPPEPGATVMTTSQTERVSGGRSATSLLPRLVTRDGALMEPRGCKRWQTVANPRRPKTAKTSENRCRELPPFAEKTTW